MAELRYELLPEDLRDGFKMYIEHGVPPGHFITAVLRNDLKEACARADLHNRKKLYDLVFWLYNYAPNSCWGSPALVHNWIQTRRLEGPLV